MELLDWRPVVGDPAPHGMYGYEYVDAGADACVDGNLPAGTQARLEPRTDPVRTVETVGLIPPVTCLGLVVVVQEWLLPVVLQVAPMALVVQTCCVRYERTLKDEDAGD